MFGPFETPAGLTAAVRGNWFTLVGFSLSCDAGLERMAAQIVSVRRASRNPAVVILAGGRVFNDRPELVTRVGADWTARDARDAVDLMRGLKGAAVV
jgi:methanogenic corrinoid protein MtbC1